MFSRVWCFFLLRQFCPVDREPYTVWLFGGGEYSKPWCFAEPVSLAPQAREPTHGPWLAPQVRLAGDPAKLVVARRCADARSTAADLPSKQLVRGAWAALALRAGRAGRTVPSPPMPSQSTIARPSQRRCEAIVLSVYAGRSRWQAGQMRQRPAAVPPGQAAGRRAGAGRAGQEHVAACQGGRAGWTAHGKIVNQPSSSH
jgi:hypothetical protein